jgi:hypothetical protein
MLMQRHLTRPSLADVMVREGILPRRTVDQVVARLGGSTTALGQTLVEEGTISETQLAQALAAQYGLAIRRADGVSGRLRVLSHHFRQADAASPFCAGQRGEWSADDSDCRSSEPPGA